MAAHHRAFVQVLRRLAQKHGVARVADGAPEKQSVVLFFSICIALELERLQQASASACQSKISELERRKSVPVDVRKFMDNYEIGEFMDCAGIYLLAFCTAIKKTKISSSFSYWQFAPQFADRTNQR